MSKRISVYAKIARYKELLEFTILKLKPQCIFCGKIIDQEDLPKGHEADKLTVHHLDEDRSHNQIENLVLAHRGCHRSYHKKQEMAKKKKGQEFLIALEKVETDNSQFNS